jgi:predicted alpha/beta-hydrolase family hydrolase
MSADVTTVVIAILGAVGTLSSPLLTQWVGNRAKRQDFELEAQRRQEDRHEDARRSVLEERRAIYAQLNTAARQYEQAIYEYLRVIAELAPAPEQLAELTKARESFRELYSDAQMIIPDTVLAAAADVSAGLGQAYGRARRLERRRPSGGGAATDPEETIEAARAFCRGDVYRLIVNLRGLMRQDLGVSSPTDEPD